jgi:hypothetical protein
VGWRDRLARRGRAQHAALHVGDPRFDDWEVVRDFEDLETARAWGQHLDDAGIESALTADWELDEFGRGDIALRVPAASWSDAEAYLSGLTTDDEDDDPDDL